MDMIEVRDLRRMFKSRAALDGISFAVERGEVFGFLGPNGAGKTTTIRILTGQLVPSGGSASVAGFDCASQPDKIRPLIGVVFEQQNIYERMTGRENLAFFANLFGLPAKRVDEVLEQVQLADRAKERAKVYSNGMKQRLVIGRALLNKPQILFLDEPTRGLDPGAAREIRRTVAELSRAGTTVFLTTHYMEEADELCQRVAFISEGKIMAMDTPRNLKIKHGERNITVLVADNGPDAVREITFSLDDPTSCKQLCGYLSAGQVVTMHSHEATLEDVFIELTGRSLL